MVLRNLDALGLSGRNPGAGIFTSVSCEETGRHRMAAQSVLAIWNV
jgi:hypothetical protein